MLLLAVSVLSASAQLPYPTAKPREPREAKPEPAQQNEPSVSPCPRLEVRASAPQYVRDGSPVKFIASLSGGDTKVAPTFNWSISAGVVSSVQGMATMYVDSTGAGVVNVDGVFREESSHEL